MVIYHHVEKIWRVLITLNFLYKLYNNEKYYLDEPAKRKENLSAITAVIP